MNKQHTVMMLACVTLILIGTSCRSPVAPSPHGMVQGNFCHHPIVSVEIALGDEARKGLTTAELTWLKSMNNHLACSELGLCREDHDAAAKYEITGDMLGVRVLNNDVVNGKIETSEALRE